MRLKKPIIAASTVALLALAACGGDGGTPVAPEENTPIEGGGAGAGQDKSVKEGPAPEIEGAQEGGTVKVLSGAGLNTMDPTEAYYTNTISILSNLVTRSLTQYVYRDGEMVLIPDLATDLGQSNEDFTEWKFTIRDGIKYENGQEVTAEDVAYGIKRSFDRETFPEGAAYSNDYFLNGDTYEGPYKSGEDFAGVEVDGMTLTLKMQQPFPDMPYWGSFPAIGPIPPGKASDPAKYRNHPWATGPYKFAEYEPEKSLTLVRNEQWDPKTDPGRHQYVDTWEMTFDDESAQIDQIMLQDQGEAQTSLSSDNVTAPNYLQFKQDAADRLVVGSDPCTFMWFPDYTQIKDIKVRQALAYAYPYEDALNASGNIEGVTRSFGTNIMPPGIPGREEFNPLPDHEKGETDTAKAKQLLEEAKATGYEIRFLYATDDPLSVDTQKVVTAALNRAGFKATPVASTIADFSTTRADPNANINVRSGGWCSDWPSGGSWFPPVFESTNIKAEGLGANYAKFSEKAVDDEIAAIQELPLEEQPAAWNKLDQMIQEKYFPVFVTGYGGVAMAHGSKIMNMEVDNTTGMPTFKDIWVSQ